MRIILHLAALAFLACYTSADCGCVFNGNIYRPGQQVDGVCFSLICATNSSGDLVWATNNTIDSQCDECRVSNIPHFYTFDCTKGYSWHGVCNYTLVSEIVDIFDSSYVPSFGIYSDFQQCAGSMASSCLGNTTYKVNPFTAVTIDHSGPITSLVVNDDIYYITNTPSPIFTYQYYSLVAWQYDNDCSRIQGPNFALEVCPWAIYIWVTPQYKNMLAGLCGFYNGECRDDQTRKDGVIDKVKFNPRDFPLSWMTREQSNRICPCLDRHSDHNNTCPSSSMTQYMDMCRQTLNQSQLAENSLRLFIGDCAKDICSNPNEAEMWLQNAAKLVMTEEKVQNDFQESNGAFRK